MFNKARLKLTIWYLVIIFVISGLFSVAFYHASTREIQRIVKRMQIAQEEWQGRFRNFPLLPPPQRAPSLEELQLAKQRLLMNLVFINGVILVISGGVAYFLAGKTLRPIKLMVDEQNQFISNSSHELRTPLSTLRAEMEGNLLEKHISDKQARKLINSNLEEVGRIQNLSNKLLQLAKLHCSLPIKYTDKLKIKEIIALAVKRVQMLANAKQINFQLKLDDSIVKGDKESLCELFVILLDNAIKFNHKRGTVRIVSKVIGDKVVILVKDQGIGIPEKDKNHIFERFYRSDKSRSQTEGFGLGLSIAKQIVEKHNGVITVKSKIGKGSIFTISLSLVQF
ncbi:hypothetical protein A2313_02890 [Candidatus Roizmanbacteria bacterium RIFOXYB2_FULL_41_10]|uniref:histidine kinase n=1 Tax=Candidatus Roizmanbacteria bacterium RIFOXYA1_FULL_41_12 TaxID=1802082 RepID=A0A1F7KF40_9BACT|nr:MAG: hypothetical protein A2262_03775 [Candidatus Roizmanbacteria bacterium RIFOXYA2_FULL_41_8]OGK66471.1 MAG: hypothetical protein A2209_01830 [Candidatus Roizmanbacteria bacterium RIFOXYA1_FULL_41_12]OGK66956.1 MAG: hypothetical protein A2377_03740 [Candidatus Roizmanbacteria bacterium RIFOXYB1_FULL_41_27]OGK71975.1 MAG: hypothetical protein A2403_03405 [Candidatus Roizmanbacteria bacterium RIFOXYC1_FULL_41_16]OGK72078.1 MAG: hypothetical protein A2313_02890 [Candidatus Roizmanbacteria bac